MPKLTNSILYLMSVAAGLVVANLYYNQPLLHQMALDFNTGQAAISNVALFTQLGYALGLLLIIPLGDKVSNKKILRYDFLLMIASLLAAAYSCSLILLIFSSFLIGFSSAIPQLFVPMAAQLADDKGRGRAIGIVMSGLLIGILGSRVISGLIGEQYGWRFMYKAATVLMVLLFILLEARLPQLHPSYKGNYASLLRSIGHYFRTEPALRLAALRGGLGFAGLSAFWTTLVFLMEDSFDYGSSVAGGFGLFGIVGAVAAAVAGKLNDRMGKNRIILYSVVVLVVSWVVFYFSASSIIGLIVGVVVVDLGFQALHITNQNIIFSKNPEARNRVNTVYMVGFFMGGSLGTVLGATAYGIFGWYGVSILGGILSLSILAAQLFFGKKAD